MPLQAIPSLFSQLLRDALTPAALIFVVLWPCFNLLFIAAVQLELGYFEPEKLRVIALKLFTAFGLSFIVLRLLMNRFPTALAPSRFWRQLVLHVVVLVGVGTLFSPVMPRPVLDVPQIRAVPLALFTLELLIYVGALSLMAQRDRAHGLALNLRQVQINQLRSQSNPHFLFNTLNLLASEITRDPVTAKEVVYDLADLLRASMKAGDQGIITVDGEIQLVTLYLDLQKRRFPDRFSSTVDIEPGCEAQVIPALLLQPAVENIFKHAVARTSDPVHIHLCVNRRDDQLELRISNDGPDLDPRPAAPEPGQGLRIIRETLALHYPGQHQFRFRPRPDGAELFIGLPWDAAPVRPADSHA